MASTNWVVLVGLIFIYGHISPTECIDRSEVLRRAKFWADKSVPYSMSQYSPDPAGKRYRTDCSGYVSMAWRLSSSLSTVTLPNVATRISKGQLQPGDVIMKGGPGSAGAAGHVVIFERWANNAKTQYWGYEQTPPHTKHRIIPYPYYNGGSGYIPYRYKSISGHTASRPTNTGCQCCKERGLRNYCGHELCGSGCNANDIYACSSKGTAAHRYGPCIKGCIGSGSNSRCRV